jgi:dihydrofolate reductase
MTRRHGVAPVAPDTARPRARRALDRGTATPARRLCHGAQHVRPRTFHFVTDGFETALDLARQAGDGDVDIAGGASTVRQALRSGELDELTLDIAPVLLGSGERLFDADVKVELEPVEVGHSPLATHVRYRVRPAR